MTTKRGKTRGIFGCMMAGKSEELIRRARRCAIGKKSFIVVKPECDTRSTPGYVESRIKQLFEAISVSHLSQVEDEASKVTTIFIDEGQFFPDLIEFCLKMEKAGKNIHVAMLDATFEKKPFPGVEGIHAICFDYVKLRAVCMGCHEEDAYLSKRISGSSEICAVESPETKYIAVCGNCF